VLLLPSQAMRQAANCTAEKAAKAPRSKQVTHDPKKIYWVSVREEQSKHKQQAL